MPRPPGRHHRPHGSSRASLHAKVFAADHARVFVGSFNFDPRSARLNTEMGFLIDSPALAQALDAAFTTDIPALSYEVGLDQAGNVRWTERHGDDLVVHTSEPGTTRWLRLGMWLLSRLPIDNLL